VELSRLLMAPEGEPAPTSATPAPPPPPAAAPATPATPAPESDEPAASESLDAEFAALLEGDETDVESPGLEEPSGEEPPPPAEPAKPVPPPAEPPKPEPTTPTEPVKAEPPAAEPPKAEPPAEPKPAEPPPPQRTAEEERAEREKRRNEYHENLVKLYEISKEDAEALDLTPAAVLPKLAANMHIHMVESVIPAIMQQIPRVIENVMLQRTQRDENEKQFYSAFPQIDRSNAIHRQTVERLLGNYLSLNPAADRQTAIREVGAAAMVALRIPYESPGTEPPPAAPPQPTSTPAVPGGGSGSPPRPRTPGLFEQLTEEFSQEDI
jgi:hypothetical protein